MPEAATSLEGLTIGEMSGVDHPAHLAEGWMVLKSVDPDAVAKVEIVENLVDAVAKAAALDPALLVQVGTEVLDLPSRNVLKALGTLSPKEGTSMTDFDKASLAPEAAAAFEALEAQVAAATATATDAVAKATAAEAIAKAAGPLSEEDQEKAEIAKALDGMPEALRKAWAKQTAELSEANAIAKAERDTRLQAEYLAKAKAMPNVGEKAEDTAALLKSLADKDADLAAKVETAFRAANEQIAAGNLFKSLGDASVPGTGSAFEQIDAIAKAAVAADTTGKTSYPDAVIKATNDNPDLAVAHRRETLQKTEV